MDGDVPNRTEHPLASRRWTRRDALLLSTLAATALFFTASLWTQPGWFDSHETIHQLTRLFVFSEALRGGQFPVRWADDLMAGWGIPFFNFYGPLAFYVAALFHLLGLSLEEAWKTEFVVMTWLAGVGMYGFVRGRAGRAAGMLAALLYQFAPYHALTLFVRGNAAEFAALSIWPFAFWGLDAALRAVPRWRGPAIPAAALAIGALACAHTLTAYMGAWNLAAFAIAGLVIAWRGGGAPRLARSAVVLGAIALAALAVSAFYTLPVVADLPHTNSRVLYERTRFHEHYPTPRQLLWPHWGHGLSVPGPDDGMDFHLGLALCAGLLAAGVLAARRAAGCLRPWILAGLIATAAHLFLMLAISRPVWSLFPASAYLQFPWRLLIPATFWASATVGWAAGAIVRDRPWTRTRLAVALVLLALPILGSAPFLKPGTRLYELPAYESDRLRQFMIDTAEGEYLPRWVQDFPPAPSRRRLVWIEGTGRAELVELASARYRFETEVPTDSLVAFETFHFPGWSFRIDGTWTEPFPHGAWGWMACELPAGARELVVAFRGTTLHRAANALTAVSILGMIGWLAIAAVHERRAVRS